MDLLDLEVAEPFLDSSEHSATESTLRPNSSRFAITIKSHLRLNRSLRNYWKQLDRILDAHSDVLGPIRSVQQGMELARANVIWNYKNYAEITEWLKDQKVEDATTSTMVPGSTRTTANT